MSEGFTIAIDGPAAAGKGSISRAVAAHYGFAHLDTGLLYRAVGAKVLLGMAPEEAALTLRAADLEEGDLRSPEVAQAASRVATIPAVRAALLDFQRGFARRAGGAVLDGRDIGTVVCPDADAKLFVTAQPETRAQRRHLEHAGRGDGLSYENVLADIRRRDERDSGRAVAPLKPAEDAILLDTTELGIEAAFQTALDLVESVLNERGQSA